MVWYTFIRLWENVQRHNYPPLWTLTFGYFLIPIYLFVELWFQYMLLWIIHYSPVFLHFIVQYGQFCSREWNATLGSIVNNVSQKVYSKSSYFVKSLMKSSANIENTVLFLNAEFEEEIILTTEQVSEKTLHWLSRLYPLLAIRGIQGGENECSSNA